MKIKYYFLHLFLVSLPIANLYAWSKEGPMLTGSIAYLTPEKGKPDPLISNPAVLLPAAEVTNSTEVQEKQMMLVRYRLAVWVGKAF